MLLPNHVSLYQAIFLILSRHVICLGTANHCKIAIGADQVLEIIADNLGKAGWSWGCVSAIDSNGRTIFVADAHRDDGKRFIVRADEKLTAFLELESAIRSCGELSRQAGRILSKLGVLERVSLKSVLPLIQRLLRCRIVLPISAPVLRLAW
jgi:hypothetical protein